MSGGDGGGGDGGDGDGGPDIAAALPEAGLEPFLALDLRVARITRAEPNAAARKPAYRLWLDLGPLGERQSSAQLTERYAAGELVGRAVIVAANLGSRRVAGFRSDVLVLGATDAAGRIALLGVDDDTPAGARVH
jgi:tRNA-binding protein